ncbi:MAG: hypothetical protein AAF497_24330, partial [Planctomycetota bacterium]
SAHSTTFLVLRSLIVAAAIAGMSWIVLTGLRILLTLLSPLGRIGKSSSDKPVVNTDWSLGEFADPDAKTDEETSPPLSPTEVYSTEKQQCRLSCDLLYESFAVDVGHRLSRDRYESLKEQYLTDDQDLATFKARANQLEVLIRQQAEVANPERRFQSFGELSDWFSATKEAITKMPLDEDIKEAMLAQLNEQFSEFVDQMVRS